MLGQIKERFHSLRYYNCDKIPTVFIVSSGRTGTNFFQTFFNSCFEKVYCEHEPHPDFFDVGMQKIRGTGPPQRDISTYIRQSRDPILRKMYAYRHEVYVESNPHAIYLIPEIKRTFKNLKFIYLYRDPRDVVRSYYSKSPINDHQKMLGYADNDHRDRIKPSDFPSDNFSYDWASMDRLHKFSWYWNRSNKIIFEALQNDSDTMFLKFEDVFQTDRKVREAKLREMIEFLGLREYMRGDWGEIHDMMAVKKNQNQVDLIPSFSKWPIKDQEMLLDLTKEMRLLLGY